MWNRVWLWFSGLALAAAALTMLLPFDAATSVLGVFILVVAVSTVIGARHWVSHPAPFYVVAAGAALYIVVSTIASVRYGSLRVQSPNLFDLAGLIAYTSVLIGFGRVAHLRTGKQSTVAAFEPVLFSAGVGVILWAAVWSRLIHSDLSTAGLVVWVGFAVLDMMCVYVGARILLSVGLKNVSSCLIAFSCLLIPVSDVVFFFESLGKLPTGSMYPLVVLAWSAAAMGALHPLAREFVVGSVKERGYSTGRNGMLLCAVVAGPISMAWQCFQQDWVALPVSVGVTALASIVGHMRMSVIVKQNERIASEERTLREKLSAARREASRNGVAGQPYRTAQPPLPQRVGRQPDRCFSASYRRVRRPGRVQGGQ